MNNTYRPRISSLTEKELAAVLKESFFKVGKELKLPVVETKIFLDEVYKHQGSIYVDAFTEAFSSCAALRLPGADTLRPQVSPMFVSKVMKLYLGKCRENKYKRRLAENTSAALTPEEKYALFLQYIITNKTLPANPDWVAIYKHLTALKKLSINAEWDTLAFSGKWKYARNAVTEWACRQYNINE